MINEIETILKKFDEELLHKFPDGFSWKSYPDIEQVKSFISSHLTELLQSLIVELEGEKKKCGCKDAHLDAPNIHFYEKDIGYNSALNLAQERIKKLIK